MKELIEYLENKIERCIEFGDMEKEKWAFGIAVKKAREIAQKNDYFSKDEIIEQLNNCETIDEAKDYFTENWID